jgi:hypothetical protein
MERDYGLFRCQVKKDDEKEDSQTWCSHSERSPKANHLCWRGRTMARVKKKSLKGDLTQTVDGDRLYIEKETEK